MTLLAGVAGQPIAHSLSPLIQNAWIRAAGLDADAVQASPQGTPLATALVSERGLIMPSLTHGIERYMHDSREGWRVAVGQGDGA